jgi:hypothetical protein
MISRLYASFFSGIRDTSEILGQIVYKFAKSKLGWLKLSVISFILLFLISTSFNIVEIGIRSQESDSNSDFGNTILRTMFALGNENGGVQLLSTILWAATIAAFALPLVSNSILTSYNRSSMVSVKNNDLHKITDSMALQYTSVLTIAQLLGLIMFFSVLKFTYSLGNHIYVIAFLIWIVSALITVLLAWVLDYILRKYGSLFKFGFVILEGLTIVYLFFLMPQLSSDFFGLASLMVESFNNTAIFITLSIALASVGAISIAGIMYFGLLTINTTAPFVVNKKIKEKKFLPSWIITLRILFRSGNVKSPILIMFLVILASIVISGDSPTIFAFIFALPMVITMAWLVNVYGITGGGNGWLFSMRSFTISSIKFFAALNISMIAVSMLAITLTAYFLDVLSFDSSVRFFMGSLTAGSIMTALASLYAIYNPIKYDVHIRGENILPPSKSLIVLGTLMIVGGVPSIYAFAFLDSIYMLALLVLILLASLIVVSIVNKTLAKGFRVNDIISSTN